MATLHESGTPTTRLDAEAENLLRGIQANGFSTWSALGLANGRAAVLQMAGAFGGEPEPVSRVEQIRIPRTDSTEIQAALYIPEHSAPPPIMLYMHGGGWVLGSYLAVDSVVRALANCSGCAIVSVDYRLAPEHKYPAALDDVMTALRWTIAHATEWGLNSAQIGIGGDSSGANLAAAAALLHREQEGIPLSSQLLVYPPLDHNYETDTYNSYASGDESALSRADVIWFHQQYVSESRDLDLPFVSPLRAEALAGLPRTLIICAEADPLLDENLAYAERLRAAGVHVELQVVPGVFHGFWRMPGVLTKARQAIEYAGRVLRSAFNTSTHQI